MSRCEFTHGARSDFREIHDYIAEDSPVNALRLIDRIESQCSWIFQIDPSSDWRSCDYLEFDAYTRGIIGLNTL